MAFLAGPPDRGQGGVLKRKPPPAPLTPPRMSDVTYTSLALGLQPSSLLPTHSNGTSNSNDNGSDPLQVCSANSHNQPQYLHHSGNQISFGLSAPALHSSPLSLILLERCTAI